MSRTLASWLIAPAAALVTAVAAAPAWADPVIDPAPIGPNQYFYGLVNDHAGQANILMGCAGPAGGTGHPLPGQTVKVLPGPAPISSDVGFTGSAAHAIAVRFPGPTVTDTPVILRDYAVSAEIPTWLTLPCSGSGTVTFVPEPTSPTARTATVTVTFISIGVGPANQP
jgi:hypothetical protein